MKFHETHEIDWLLSARVGFVDADPEQQSVGVEVSSLPIRLHVFHGISWFARVAAGFG
jgi:hypothetical protein